MLFKKKNQVKDERIEKESNKIMPAMFYLFSVILLACLVVKLVLGEPWYNFLLEILCLAPAWGYALVKCSSYGVLFLKEKDEALVTIRNEIMAKAFTISFSVIIFGELVYMFFTFFVLKVTEESFSREWMWMLLYLAAWFLPAIIMTVLTVKNGWIVWGSKKREATGKKQFAKRTAVGALFYGIMMGLVEFLEHGFSEKVLIITFACSIVWGVLFYLFMILFIKISEKNADKSVKEKEEGCEE